MPIPLMATRNPLRRLLGLLSFDHLKLVRAITYSTINKICDIFPELLIGLSTDVLVAGKTSVVAWVMGTESVLIQLCWVGGLTAVLWILEAVFEHLYSVAWQELSYTAQQQLRLKAYQNLQTINLASIENINGGELLNALTDDIDNLQRFLGLFPNEVIQLTVSSIVLGAIFFAAAPFIALLTLAPLPLVAGLVYHFHPQLAQAYHTMRQASANLTSYLSYQLHGLTTIRSYVTEKYEIGRLRAESKAYKRALLHSTYLQTIYDPLVRLAIMAGFIMALVVGGHYAQVGNLSATWYASLVFLSQRFLVSFTTISTMSSMYEESQACAERILTILEKEPIVAKRGLNRHITITPVIAGQISFTDLTFSYAATNEPLFKHLNLSIPAGTTCAIVGPTGCGKSTLVNLLLGFYKVQSGAITLDNHNIETLTSSELHHAIALVSQEVYLINGTIADNIRYGTFTATEAEIVEAATQAHAHEFITRLPDGYRTMIQEHGHNLSGGQRQLISVARALLKKAPILIFDEATSGLDNLTEKAVEQTIDQLHGTCTIVLIAHRLPLVRHADAIHVLQSGSITESGTYTQLMRHKGMFARLWQAERR